MSWPGGGRVGDHAWGKDFLRGARHLRPPPTVIVPRWDLQTVLDYLGGPPYEPMGNAALKLWTLKTVFLVAIASGARSSELIALDIRPEYTVFRDGFVSLRHPVSFMPKVPSVTNRSREIVLQHLPARGFPLDRHAGRTCTLCPVRALRHYLELKPLAHERFHLAFSYILQMRTQKF